MFNTDKYYQRYLDDLAPHVQGQVLAMGVLSRPGAMAGVLVGQVSGIGRMINNAGAKKKAGGLPQNVVLAVTEHHVYVFNYKPGGWGGGLKVKDPIVVWPREAIHVQHTGSGTLADTLTINIAGQEPIQLDSNKMPGFKSDFNAPLFQLLAGSSTT
jgi:hypothetical protein